MILLPFCKNFNIEKHQQYLVCCFFLSEYVLSTIFELFILKMHQPYLCYCNLGSKYTTKNVEFSAHVVLWPSKHQLYPFSFFKTSKYVSQPLGFFLIPFEDIIFSFFCGLACNCISGI